MKLRHILFLAVLALPCAASAETAVSDPKAVAIADQIMHSLGGKAQWDSLRGIRWSFGFESNDTVRSLRRHSWDKWTGWHRVEGKNRAGQPFVFIENMNDSTTGMAWMNGTKIEGDSLMKLMKLAKRLWTNDTYWLLMPYKLRDPGVNLRYDAAVKDTTGKMFDRLALSFEHVGQTPGDKYWVYVDRDKHRIEKWDFLLEGDKPPAQNATWGDWKETGGFWFANAHRVDRGNVFTRDVEAVTGFRPGEFTAP